LSMHSFATDRATASTPSNPASLSSPSDDNLSGFLARL
jgi:hypothetical protein